MDISNIRNFSIIAHIDHGKSTLADRLLEQTGLIQKDSNVEQLLDKMDIERERGITIKGSPVSLPYKESDGKEYLLNMIDTPGHVDFSYEVSRALEACEGAVLLVDASQGVQAQTIANVDLALENKLTIIPVINKIDLPQSEPDRVAEDIVTLFGFQKDEILFLSAKTGENVDQLLKAIVKRIPSPKVIPGEKLRALIFDSLYDPYRGIITYVRVFDGVIRPNEKIFMMGTKVVSELSELGIFVPEPKKKDLLSAGSVGYFVTNLKSIQESKVGDTITLAESGSNIPVPGFRKQKSMVFAGIYPTEGEDYNELRKSLERLQLNDASISFTPDTTSALGFGFRCGFLGLLHMEIVQERLEREYGLQIIMTAPTVMYKVILNNNDILELSSPALLPPNNEILTIQEPWLNVSVVTPEEYIGSVMDLISSRRGEFGNMEYLQSNEEKSSEKIKTLSVLIRFSIPFSEMLAEFYDHLKSCSRGYASLDYRFADYVDADLVKLDIIISGSKIDALSMIVHKNESVYHAKKIVKKLKEIIPKQLFDIPLQAAIAGKIISRETIRALRKDVLAKCYGGDITRKRKLLEKQKEGKKRMKKVGSVEVPQEAFMALLKK